MFVPFPPNEWKVSEKRNSNPRMFTSFTPNDSRMFISSPLNDWKLCRGSVSSYLCEQPYPHSHPIFDGICPKDVTLWCVKSALSSFNEQSLSKQDPKYDLVDALNCIKDSKKGVYHCNFIARLQNQGEAQDKLFFAELDYNEEELVLRCPLCCILGPRSTETGQYGCKSCQKHPGLIQHPENGFFRSMILSCKAGHCSGLWDVGKFFAKVSTSQSHKEIKLPPQESVSPLSKHPQPDDENGCNKSALSSVDEQNLSKQGPPPDGSCSNNQVSCYPSPPQFDGRCPKNMILESAESAISNLGEQSLSEQGPLPGGICGNSQLSCYPSSLPRFDGRCPKNMILESAGSAISNLSEQSLSEQGPFPGGICGNSQLSRCPSSPRFDVRCPKNKILESAESAVSNLGEQSLSEQGPLPGGICGNSQLSCYPSPPRFDGRCPKNMIPESADSAKSKLDKQSLLSLYTRDVPSWSEPFMRIPGLCSKFLILKCIETALSSFNEQSLSKQGPEYELIEALNCISATMSGVAHCNFIARPKNQSEAEDKLFFAEVHGHLPHIHCPLCCILGPKGTETGDYGCKSCLRLPGLVEHPEDGFSNVYQDAEIFDDGGRTKLSLKADYGSDVDKSQYREEIKFHFPGIASTSSTQTPCFGLPSIWSGDQPPRFGLPTFDGRCSKDMSLRSADHHPRFGLPTSDGRCSKDMSHWSADQPPPFGLPNFDGRCSKDTSFWSADHPPRFSLPTSDGRCPKDKSLWSAKPVFPSSNEQSLTEQKSGPFAPQIFIF